MENDNENLPTAPRPLGYWLRTVDHLIAREFAASLSDDDVSRRDWMLLNVVDGTVDAPWLAERLARKSGRVRRLADRGWIVQTDDGWELTDTGRTEKERLAALVDTVRTRVAGAVSPEDLATTVASLEAIARELGWDETAERDPGFGRGFGRPGLGRGFGHPGFGGRGAHGFAEGHGRPGFGPDAEGCRHRGERHPGHGDHGHGHGGRRHDRHGERAFQRGFDAGYARGRAAASEPVT